ncbi:hypothetical protein JCM10213v2_006542 [Rhodosporidiobolus nylandii]
MPSFPLPVESGSLYYELVPAVHDPSKPTVLVLPPTWSDSSVVLQRFLPAVEEDAAERFNVLTLDLRSHGRTETTPFKGIDGWTQAVDIALLLSHLQIPSVHLVTTATVGCSVGLSFALLFPAHTLSLSLLGFAPIYELPEDFVTYKELQQSWMQGDDPELFFEAMEEILFYAFKGILDWDEKDWFAGMWSRRYAPSAALRIFETTLPVLSPTRITRDLVRQIRCPALIVAGDADVSCPAELALEFKEDLVASADAQVHIIQDAPNFLAFTHSHLVTPLLLDFLSTHAFPATPSPSPSRISFPAALSTLASLFPSLAGELEGRNPFEARSYSLVDPTDEVREVVWKQAQELHGKGFETFASGEKETWEEGGRLMDSRPGWRYSSRNANDAPPPPSATFASMWAWGSTPLDSAATSTTVTTTETTGLSSSAGSSGGDLQFAWSPILMKAGKAGGRG